MTAEPAPTAVPRYELHCHLDGSVRPSTVAELARHGRIALSGPVEQLVTAAQVVEQVGRGVLRGAPAVRAQDALVVAVGIPLDLHGAQPRRRAICEAE